MTTKLALPPKTKQGTYDLRTGEEWEEYVASCLTIAGVPCRRLEQRFVPASELREYRDRIASGKSHEKASKVLKTDYSLLGRFQIDLGIKNGNGKLRTAEVKSKPSLRYWDIYVGKAANWSDKGYHNPLLFIVDQNDGQIFIAPQRDQWTLTIGSDGLECYRVKRDELMPVEDWIKALNMPVAQLWQYHQQTSGKWQFHPSLG